MTDELVNNVKCFSNYIKEDFCKMKNGGEMAFKSTHDHGIEKYIYEVGTFQGIENLKSNFSKLMRNAKNPDGTKKRNFGWTQSYKLFIQAVYQTYHIEV